MTTTMNGQASDKKSPDHHAPFTPFVDHSFTTALITPAHPSSTTKSKHKHHHHHPDHTSTDIDDVVRSGDTKRLKSLLRSHNWAADDPVRGSLWYKVCCVVHRDVARGISIYSDMVARVFGEGATAHDATLPPFIDITTLEHYHLNHSGVKTARRVVCILEQECPDITYCPMLFASTCLLLHYMGEEDAYNALCAMLRSREKYMSQTKIAHDATKYVLKELARKHAKGCYQHIMKQGMVVEGVLSRWVWWIFRDLPFAYLVRVMDCYLLEGPKVLYRVALAIMQLYYKCVVKGRESSKQDPDIARGISLFCEEMPATVSVDKLLKAAFGIRGLSKKDVVKLKIKKEMFVQSKINVTSMQTNMPTSPSVDSLSVKVVRSHSGPISMQDINSALLNLEQWQDIYGWLHPRWALLQPRLLFSTSEHGTSLTTFFNKIDGYEPTLIVIRSTSGDVFGAFCSMDWACRKNQNRNLSYFGNGETFLFALTPMAKKYEWVGRTLKEKTPASSELYQAGDNTRINIGGGGGVAISIDENLNMCRSDPCDTFGSPALVEGRDFQCGTLEVFCFENR